MLLSPFHNKHSTSNARHEWISLHLAENREAKTASRVCVHDCAADQREQISASHIDLT